MKSFRLLLLGAIISLAAGIAGAQPTPVQIQPATQAQVNAGSPGNVYVSPVTLAGWSGGGGGGSGGVSNQKVVTQTQSFTLGEALYNDGTGSTSAPHYSAADNSAIGTAHVDGTVTATGATSFTITFGGYENTISGLTAGKQYYLGTAGALTSTAPVSTTAFLTTVLYTGVSGDGVVEIGAPQSLALIPALNVAVPPPVSGGNATGTVNINWAAIPNGGIINFILTGNTTFTFSGATSGQNILVDVAQTGTNSFTVTWPTAKWPAGTAPIMTAGAAASDATSFYDLGGTFKGSSVQNLK